MNVKACIPFLATLSPALAAGEAPAFDGGSVMVQLALNLLLVVGMIVLAAWLYRRLGRVQTRAAGGQWMQIRASLPLGLREKLVLVQVGREYLVLGITPQRMECLARLRDLDKADFDAVLQTEREKVS